MSMFEISRALGARATEAVEPGTSVVITQGDRILCDQSFTEVSSITRIDNNLQLIVADNPPIIFNQFFTSKNSLIQFKDQQFTNDDLNKILSVYLTSTESNQVSHEIFLSPGSSVLVQPGENYYLNSKDFNIKDLHRHGEDLLIQSHDEAARKIALLKDFFKTPEPGLESPQLNIVDPTAGATQDMIVNPHSSIFQWNGEPLPVAVVGSLYGYYFKLEGAQTEEYHLVSRTEKGILPSWMTFSHLGNGQYYLSGIPPSGAVGNHEIFIEAYCIKNKIGFHTQQSFELSIKLREDTTTRAAIDDVAAAEFRSLSEITTANSFLTGIIALNQMPYMSMPEIAVMTSLGAINPAIFNQMFSTLATADQLSHPEELADQMMLESLNVIQLDIRRNQILSGEGAEVTSPHVMIDVSNIEVTTSGESTKTTESITTPTSTETQTPVEAPPQVEAQPPSPTEQPIITPFTPVTTTVTHNLLISTPPPPPSGPLFIDLSQPFNGFTFNGQAFAYSGREATIVRDMTGDGLGDLIVGVYIGASYYGEVHLIPGSTTPFPNQFDITNGSVNGTVFTATSPNANLYPYHIAAVSDFNGDGLDDILIVGNDSSRYSSYSQTFYFQNAKAYLVFGDSGGFAANVDISTLVSTGDAVEFSVVNPSSGVVRYSFTNGTYLGDINGDGLADIIISDYTSMGIFTRDLDVFVVMGTLTPSNQINLSMLDGTNGFELTPTVNQPSFLGMTGVDINGDGFNDVFLNTYRTTPYNNQVTVTFGRSTGFSPSFDPTTLPVGEGFIIHNSSVNDSFYTGLGVRDSANIGDFNHDGIDDVLIIEKTDHNDYIIFGSPSFSTISTFDLATIDGSNGIKLIGGPDAYIVQVAYLGDVNGDGLPDIGIVNLYSYEGRGAAYIIFGSTDLFSSGIDLTNLTRDQGFTIIGTDTYDSLYSISGGADINGDGLSDLVVSGPYINNSNGASYVIYGSNFNGEITQMGTIVSETLNGTSGDDVIYGAGGNDTINALGGNDFISALGNSKIYAGQGDDTIVYYGDNDLVQGDTETDTLWFKYDNTHVNFIGTSDYTGIDAIDLMPMRTLVGNSVTLDAATVLAMSDANLMTIMGNAHNILTLIATDMWTPSSSLPGYTTYTSMSGSVVNVDDDVHVTFAPPASPVTLSFTVPALTDGVHGFTLTNTTLLNATSSTIIQDGDGFDDLFMANGFSAGSSPFTRAFIVEGQATFGASLPFDDPSLTTDVFNNTSFGSPISAYGQHVNSIGDFDGDGLQDILISEFFGGYSHIILGQPGGFAATSLIATVGINLPGNYNSTTSATLGDVNGDGLTDIALSDSQSGWGAVIFGTTTPGSSINTTTLTGSDGFQISRPISNISAGLQDFGTNDINGDGKNDIFVSYFDTSVNIGGIGVILGNTPVFSSTVTVSSAGISGANGFIITNSAGIPGPNNYLVNPTEIGNFAGKDADAIALSSKDTVYVIFGSTLFPTGSNFDVTSINGINGFVLNTASHLANITSIAYLGDVNGDALSDFGFLDSNAYSGFGAVYVVFGSTAAFSATPIDFTTMNSDQGFVITDPLGFTPNQTFAGILSAPTVSGGGDLNGDGLSEIVITSGSDQHIIYGQNFNGAITQLADPNQSEIQGVGTSDIIYGSSGNDIIIGGSGDSFISAGAGLDVINGGTGNNTIVYDGFDTSVDGGLGGENTLWFENDGILADLQGTTIFKDFDVINLRPLQSLQGNTIDLDPLGVFNMSDTNTLQIDGGAHDALVLHNDGADSWSAGPIVNIGGAFYTTYSSAVTLSTVYAENTFVNNVSIV